MYSVGILATGPKWQEVLQGVTQSVESEITGWVDPVASGSEAAAGLIEKSDLVWIPEKINGGMDEAIRVIRRSRHLSLGFPVSDFTDQAECLVKLAQEAQVQVQVGHPERHRLVFRSSQPFISHPQHIRLVHHDWDLTPSENPRKIFREILADIDLVLGLSGSQSKKVRTHASFLRSGELIQIDSRIEFHNGSLLSLTIRNFADAPARHIEIIQESGILRIDLINGTSRMSTKSEDGWLTRDIWPMSSAQKEFQELATAAEEERAHQCLNFIHALEMGKKPLSSLEEGYTALEITRQIEASVGLF
jgi:predicted dehydrogenase